MSKRIVIAAVLFVSGLLAVLQAPTLFVNPGKLIAGHAKIKSDCFQCHAPLMGPSDEKCIACHKPNKIGMGKPGKVPFHQQLQENLCANCHTDHLGKGAAKATRTFDHALIAVPSQNACRQCHAQPEDTLHWNLRGECSACHNDQRWKPATFDHTLFFRFDRHHSADCASCHPNERYDRYTCYDCHEHSRRKIRHEHLEEGIRDFQNCTACHKSGDEDDAERIWRDMRRRGISPRSIGKPRGIFDVGSGERSGSKHLYRDHEEEHGDD